MRVVVAATITRTNTEGWTSTRELPLFFLDSRIQGFTSVSGGRSLALRLLKDAAGEDAEISLDVQLAEGQSCADGADCDQPGVVCANDR